MATCLRGKFLGYDWQRLIAELSRYGQVVLSFAALTDSGGRDVQPLLFSVRGDPSLPSQPYMDQYFPGVHLHREQLTGSRAALVMTNRRAGSFEIPTAPEGTSALWITGGDDIGFAAPCPMPRMHYYWGWPGDAPAQQSIQSLMDAPLLASGHYYPTLRDALLQVLLGRTRNPQRSIYPAFFGVVSLGYNRAYLGAVEYVADEGVVVQVVESEPAAAGGYETHLLYQLHASDLELREHKVRLDQGGVITVPTGAPPLFYWAALVSPAGDLVDYVERHGPSDSRGDAPPPSPMAVAEALDFLGSAWRNVFKQPLIGRVQLTSAANLTQAVNRREDFESRLSHLCDLLNAFRIGDDLLKPRRTRQGKLAPPLIRMKQVIQEHLPEPDGASESQAIDELRAILELRAAVQHRVSTDERKPDLPTALRRLRIGFPPDWRDAWIKVQLGTIESVAEIRRALLATLPE